MTNKKDTILIDFKVDTRPLKAMTRELRELDKVVTRLKKIGVSVKLDIKNNLPHA